MYTLKFVLFFLLLLTHFGINAQQYLIQRTPQIKQAIVYYYNEDTHHYYYLAGQTSDYGYIRTIIPNTDPILYEYKIFHTVYKFDLTGLPPDAYNITAYLQAYRISGSQDSKIVSVPDNLNFNNLEDCYYQAHIGSEYFTVNINPGTDHNITGYVLPRLNQGYINFGLRGVNYYNNNDGNISIILKIYYDAPSSITADNNFTAPNGTHGLIVVSGYSGNQTAPFTFSKTAGQSVSLTAVSPQNDNQSHQMIWHTGSIRKSEWQRNGVFKSYNQTYTFNVAADDNGKTYQAQLRKNYAISRNDDFREFDNLIGAGVLWHIVEQNSGQISAPSTQTINGKLYNFSYWADNYSAPNPRTIMPNDNITYTAVYKYANHSNNTAGFDKDSQRKIVKSYNSVLHKIYESFGSVWYETSAFGSSWQIMNGGKPVNNLTEGPEAKSPSIDYLDSQNLISADAYIVYQQKTSNGKYKIKLAKFNDYGQKVFDVDVFTSTLDYSSFDAKPVISVTRSDISFGNKVKFVVVWQQKAEGSYQNGLYYYGGIDNGTTISWHYVPQKIGPTDLNSTNPTIAVYKYPVGVLGHHLAWQHGNSSIYYTSIFDSWNGGGSGGISYGTIEHPSYGNSWPVNREPSIAVTNNNWTGNYIDDSPKLVWKEDDHENVVHRSKVSSGAKSQWGSFYKYQANDDINSANISSSAEGEFVIVWSEMVGYYNRYIKSSNLGQQINTGTRGKDIQVANFFAFWDGFEICIFNNGYGSGLPYSFQLFNVEGTFSKENAGISKEGRSGTVMKNDAEFYFAFGDVYSNDNLVKFIEADDTLNITTDQSLSSCLITEAFSVNDNSTVKYSVIYGLKDSLTAYSELSENEFISFKVELVDDVTGELLGEYDNIMQTKSSLINYETWSYQLNMNGIGNRSVRLKLVVEDNLNSENYALSKLYSDGAPLSKSNYSSISWKGSDVIDEYDLSQNYPNPFNPSTIIKYQIPKDGVVTIKIYDILGNEIKTIVNEQKTIGKYTVTFDASDLASGVYLYQIRVNDFVSTRKMLLLK
jgi:hypothetical protein